MPDDTSKLEFTLEEALTVRREMRAALGLGEERFGLPDLLRMIGDEMQRMRAAGRDDEEIARLIREGTGKEVAAGDLAARDAGGGHGG